MFNKKAKDANTTTNFEGAMAYQINPHVELYTAVVTAALSDQFYEKAEDKIQRIRELIKQLPPQFVAKLAIYAREKMYLRAIPLVLTVELAKIHQGDALVSTLVNRVVQRADEITEILAYYALANERKGIKKLGKLSKQIQKGLAEVFNKFDEYQLAKYNRDNEIKLRDALFLVHPKAKDEAQQAIFDKVAKDELQTPYTWEVELSVLGQRIFANETEKNKAFQNKWQELIDSNKLGYMALLRNLRNFLQTQICSEHIKKVAQKLSNAQEVANAKQFPFRFLAAYLEIERIESPYTNYLLESLEKATQASIINLQGFDLDTTIVLAADVSGSMQMPISKNSSVQFYDIGLILAMLLQTKCQSVITGFFGDTWKIVNLPKNQILSNANKLRKREGEVGYSTNAYLVIDDLITQKIIADKVMFFTDCQMWDSSNNQGSLAQSWQYYKKIAPQAKIYLFDLAGHGQMPLRIPQKDVHLIAGWSEKIFDILHNIENGQNALNEIEKIIL